MRGRVPPPAILLGILVGLVTWGATPDAGAQSATTQPAARGTPAGDAEVAALVDQLSDDDWQVRRRAQEALVKLGRQAVPHLRPLAERAGDPEVRSSAAAILARIEQAQVSGATLITVHLDDVPTRAALDLIQEQARVELPSWPESRDLPGRVTLHYDREPFWTVMLDLCRQAGIRPHRTGGGGRGLRLLQDPGLRGLPAYTGGPVLVLATGAHESRSISYGEHAGGTSVRRTIGLEFIAEPKLRVITQDRVMHLTALEDDAGASLLVGAASDRRTAHASPSDDPMWIGTVTLPDRASGAASLARLAGVARVTIAGRVERVEVNDVLSAAGEEFTVAGRRLVVRDVAQEGRTTRLQLTVHPPADLPRDHPLRGQPVRTDEFELLDEAGEPMTRNGYNASGSDEQYDLELRFSTPRGPGRAARAPATLVWDVPVETTELEVPFEFEDLPLPQ